MGLFEKDKLTERDQEITRLYKELSTVVHEVNKILDTEGCPCRKLEPVVAR